MEDKTLKYWSMVPTDVIKFLESSMSGLSVSEADNRLKKFGENSITSSKRKSKLMLLLDQFKNPIIIILLLATIISAMTGEVVDSVIIFLIIIASSVLSFLQEYSANNAMEKLKSHVKSKATVLRDGKEIEISLNRVVPGDILLLSAGSLIAADGLLIDSLDLFVNQSILTGESIPQEKTIETVDVESNLSERINCIYMGTSVQSGSAKAIVVNTGENTEFGNIAEDIKQKHPETEFESGIRRFGYLLSVMMFILTIFVFAINVIFKRPPIDSFLFSIALAVGITPQLLPAIISITLSKGSKLMAKEGVIVKRLSAIENFGSMDILCTDKTGTLTEGIIQLDSAADIFGEHSDEVFYFSYINSSFQTGFVSVLDDAIKNHKVVNTDNLIKVGEIPYDFTRKRLSVIIDDSNKIMMTTKGALNNILSICKFYKIGDVINPLDDKVLKDIDKLYYDWSSRGMRVLGVAMKYPEKKDKYYYDDEKEMFFLGFLLFFDPPKEDVKETVGNLMAKGVQLRIVTGDNKYVAAYTAKTVGLENTKILTGAEIQGMNDDALWNQVENTNIFAEVDPNQKERIIRQLKRRNHIVGYMGDGINDVPALHIADIGISVNTAVDVAKESADFVLLEKSLQVLNRGIELGRTAFENTIKYISITTSANFGNMFSMAGASLLMPFLPLLPKQILLINFLTDFPAITLSGDSVDDELLKSPRRWNIRFIRSFMLIFGLISSIFDYITFLILLKLFNANETTFQSSWFIISIVTELAVLLIMRTRKPFFRSSPSVALRYSILLIFIMTFLIIYTKIGAMFNVGAIPLKTIGLLIIVVLSYAVVTEIAKHFYFKNKGI